MSPSNHTAELALSGAPSHPDEQADELPLSEHAPSFGLPRLLEGVVAQGAMDLQTHIHTHGPPPTPRRRERRGASVLIDRIEQAGLGGRGGAAFPTAKKMRTVAAGKGKPIVVVNATEGEPASLKDRTLLETMPHLVLDGAASPPARSERTKRSCAYAKPPASRSSGPNERLPNAGKCRRPVAVESR